VEKLISIRSGWANLSGCLLLRLRAEKVLHELGSKHTQNALATVCQSMSRNRPSKTILPSPLSEGIQLEPSRFVVTVSGSPERVQSTVS
jgi:hypothetical protein